MQLRVLRAPKNKTQEFIPAPSTVFKISSQGLLDSPRKGMNSEINIGRKIQDNKNPDDNDIIMHWNDREISSKHAQINWDKKTMHFYIYDRGSLFGTLIQLTKGDPLVLKQG